MTNTEITPEFVQGLLDAITPGEWFVDDDWGAICSMVKPGRQRNVATVNRSSKGELGDEDFIIASPAIARAYLELAKKVTPEAINNRIAEECAPQLATALLQAQEENTRLKNENWDTGEALLQAKGDFFRLRKIIEQQREALEFYADESIYYSAYMYFEPVYLDKGEKAKKALAAAPQECKGEGWLPIESAPKDFKPIWLIMDGEVDAASEITEAEDGKRWFCGLKCGAYPIDELTVYKPMTEFPLPPPPASTAGEAGE